MLDSWLERVRGLCGEGFAAPTMSVVLFRMAALIVLDRRPNGDRFSRVLDEELSSLKADRSRGVLGPGTPGHDGTQETLPNLGRSR